MSARDEFYVGYLPTSPPGIAATVRRAIAVAVALGLSIGLLLVTRQQRFDPGTFEFGIEREFRGVLIESPHPLLVVPGAGGRATTSYYLSGFGKRGADDLVRGLDGRPVELVGSLIDNGYQRMIEVHRAEAIDLATTDGESAALFAWSRGSRRSLGRMTLSGEIVDSKCHLGVMKPGRSKPHKACAIRCISGGVPPVLRVEDASGGLSYLLLVGPDGESVNRRVLRWVAEPVEIPGEVVRDGELLMFLVDPAEIRLAR